MDPFCNQCRAYRRLIERGANGKIAARRYGYTTISAERGYELAQRFGVEDWDRQGGNKQSIRTIVKQLVQDDSPLTHKVAIKILRGLRKMRKFAIYPTDVRARNYKAGLLVGMSIESRYKSECFRGRIFGCSTA